MPRTRTPSPLLRFAFSAALLSTSLIAPALAGRFNVDAPGTLGPSSDYFGTAYNDFTLNTDSGNIDCFNGLYSYTIRANAGRLLNLPNSPQAMAFDFTTFDVWNTAYLHVVGSRPAVVTASGNVTISGTINVTAAAKAGGEGGNALHNDGNPGQGPGGGSGGGGPGGFVNSWNNMYTRACGGGGAGGSYLTMGFAGSPGNPVQNIHWDGNQWVGDDYVQMTGGTIHYGGFTLWETLEGGGGGGGGGRFYIGYDYNGIHGGNGGGVLLISTDANLTVLPTGQILANGQGVASYNDGEGGGGGGAGGYLAFSVDGIFQNDGLLSATGAPGTPDRSGGYTDGYCGGGSGAAGRIYIDPTAIINNGTIDLSSGHPFGFEQGLLATDPGMFITGEGTLLGTTTVAQDFWMPEPATLTLFLPSTLVLLLRPRKKS